MSTKYINRNVHTTNNCGFKALLSIIQIFNLLFFRHLAKTCPLKLDAQNLHLSTWFSSIDLRPSSFPGRNAISHLRRTENSTFAAQDGRGKRLKLPFSLCTCIILFELFPFL